MQRREFMLPTFCLPFNHAAVRQYDTAKNSGGVASMYHRGCGTPAWWTAKKDALVAWEETDQGKSSLRNRAQ